MRITIESIQEITIEEFAEKHDLEMVIRERKTKLSDPSRFYAMFRYAEVVDGGMLVGVSGDGFTHERAISDYASKISLRTIAIHAMRPERKTIEVPRLIIK